MNDVKWLSVLAMVLIVLTMVAGVFAPVMVTAFGLAAIATSVLAGIDAP